MNRTQRARDRDALIADLDTARTEVVELKAGIHALIDDLETSGSARVDDVCQRLQELVGPPHIARELRVADGYHPKPALELIRGRIAGGAR